MTKVQCASCQACKCQNAAPSVTGLPEAPNESEYGTLALTITRKDSLKIGDHVEIYVGPGNPTSTVRLVVRALKSIKINRVRG